jgi:hypothetical protein
LGIERILETASGETEDKTRVVVPVVINVCAVVALCNCACLDAVVVDLGNSEVNSWR